eukprot:8884833-Karenia_brevis.AAC.1
MDTLHTIALWRLRESCCRWTLARMIQQKHGQMRHIAFAEWLPFRPRRAMAVYGACFCRDWIGQMDDASQSLPTTHDQCQCYTMTCVHNWLPELSPSLSLPCGWQLILLDLCIAIIKHQTVSTDQRDLDSATKMAG